MLYLLYVHAKAIIFKFTFVCAAGGSVSRFSVLGSDVCMCAGALLVDSSELDAVYKTFFSFLLFIENIP